MERREASRHVPVASRDHTFERAGYQCEYRSPEGRRCTQRVALQIEHKRLWSRTRSHDERDLLCFCPAHHRLAAEDALGEEFIAGKIDARRRESAVPWQPAVDVRPQPRTPSERSGGPRPARTWLVIDHGIMPFRVSSRKGTSAV